MIMNALNNVQLVYCTRSYMYMYTHLHVHVYMYVYVMCLSPLCVYFSYCVHGILAYF